ncbi:hypothetical protein WAK64_10040 [Bacillus spongiae]|uniref:Uncharacterized protein n=1 Tax=Bacillus spongiae TaxID=2683610 RepID=A0ABU8HDU8_9BACI
MPHLCHTGVGRNYIIEVSKAVSILITYQLLKTGNSLPFFLFKIFFGEKQSGKVSKKKLSSKREKTKEVEYIKTLKGVMHANAGDCVVTGIESDKYEIYEVIYEQVEE